jgi:predicted nucleotidyltransferase
MITKNQIQLVANKIGKFCQAKDIILFGSYANGTATENSDVDLLIIAESTLPRFKRAIELYKLFKPYPFSMDLLVYTPLEIEENRKLKSSFISKVLKEGTVIYGKKLN